MGQKIFRKCSNVLILCAISWIISYKDVLINKNKSTTHNSNKCIDLQRARDIIHLKGARRGIHGWLNMTPGTERKN